MELAASIEPFLCPLAAFLDPNDNDFYRLCQAEHNELVNENQSTLIWGLSACNPCNRVNAFSSKTDHSWRVDGSTAMGRQLFITPTFLLPELPVKRIDLIIPCQSKHPTGIRRMLRSSALYHVSSASVRQLEIVQYLEHILSRWSSGIPYFDQIYKAVPFGSRIVVEELAADINKIKVRLIPNKGFAEKLVPLVHLYNLWKLPAGSWPVSVPVEDLQHISHLNGNVSVVQLPHKHGSELFVFKTNLREPNSIYHELKLLLTMAPHPNIIPKPRYVVTTADDGAPSPRLLGFILDYYGSGTLQSVLEGNSRLPLRTKMRWAMQIVRTMSAISESPAQFYSDLKPDNLMLTQDGLDLVFIDFEQAGNWDTFLAPELSYQLWMENLSHNPGVPLAQRERYENILKIVGRHGSGEDVLGPTDTFRNSWKSLPPPEREQAMVFTVGKILWCIFEEVAHTRNSTDERYEKETPIEFPAFSRTPESLRSLIQRCTMGAPEWTLKAEYKIIREDLRFVSVPTSGVIGAGDECTPHEAVYAAKRMWTCRVRQMQDFMETRARWLAGASVEGDDVILGYPCRPSLAQVLSFLKLEDKGKDAAEA
ncbi:hypothetical protein GGS23DRAFT_593922 [Durotheca rogersii]|uniref:uncharacterized protein n=1 Tax=Durotheca rogersii TaxID=419775 RepID=UPI00222118E2|nr:uncharacterized protein GGS23DRAFT_593922 [Durotheca rogersii]KAI5865744.1 hypothetical protein GGS23DRAFT_593922 [Durotheca rogersii]